jgi:TonB family protein
MRTFLGAYGLCPPLFVAPFISSTMKQFLFLFTASLIVLAVGSPAGSAQTATFPSSSQVASSSSPTAPTDAVADDDILGRIANPDSIYQDVERLPRLVLCDGAMKTEIQCTQEGIIRHMMDHLEYPRCARRKGIEGKVLVQFVIEKDGSLNDIQVIKPVHKSLDKAAVEVVASLPPFLPGEIGKQPVRVAYMLPVHFKLN